VMESTRSYNSATETTTPATLDYRVIICPAIIAVRLEQAVRLSIMLATTIGAYLSWKS
jgi:hypothetical protein